MADHSLVWTEERLARLSLGSFPGFGSRSLRKLWRAFPAPSTAWTASVSKLSAAGIAQKQVSAFTKWRKTFDPARQVYLLKREGIRVLFPGDPGFPQALQTSSDPPEILFVRGVLPDAPAVAVVGTRKMTSYGQSCVEAIIPGLVRAGLVILSGLALGVDAAVHEAVLAARGRTCAVLGTGIDQASVYPRSNLGLAERILEADGALVTEFPPGTDGRKEHFPMRNRLLAAWSLATVVVEAAEGSGSLITAKLALEENREVLAVPGPIWSASSAGANRLLKLGAGPCLSSQDVLEALAIDRPQLVEQARAALPLDPLQERLLSVMDEPRHVDDLVEQTELKTAAVSSHLALLEMKGLVKSVGGQMWVRIS